MSFSADNPTHLQELKDEITNDPLALGYAAVLTETPLLLALLNDKNPAYIVSKPKISAAEVRAAVTYDAYNNLAIDEQEWLRWITGSNGVNEESLVVTPDLRLQLTSGSTFWAVSNRTEMQAAMLAIIDVPGSRAEVLWGFGSTISRAAWFTARDLP
jgi:hypothetical protein